MIKRVSFILSIFMLIGTSACSMLPAPTQQPAQPAGQVQFTATAEPLTSTTLSPDTPPVSPSPTEPGGRIPQEQPPNRPTLALRTAATITTPSEETPAGVVTVPPPLPAAQSPERPCDLAIPGRPFDVTVPDETRFYPGETFSKTWRLVNAGQCTWTRDYAVVWFSGTDMGLSRIEPLNAVVAPGSALDVTVEMVAPEAPGTYQSNWKLRSSQGELFGIGPNGDAPFWSRIIVVAMETPTATAPPIPTEPLVYSAGMLQLTVGQFADLDSGQADQEQAADVLVQEVGEGEIVLTAVNGARLVWMGGMEPGRDQCVLAEIHESLAESGSAPVGTYLCYRTDGGLPGRIYLASTDVDSNQVILEFLTWAMP